MPHSSATRRFAAALRSAAHRYGRAIGKAETSGLAVEDTRFLLARLGLPIGLLDMAGEEPPPLSDDDRTTALSRLRSEGRRLARLARARHPAYDLNRHIAVRRVLVTLEAVACPENPRRRSRPT